MDVNYSLNIKARKSGVEVDLSLVFSNQVELHIEV